MCPAWCLKLGRVSRLVPQTGTCVPLGASDWDMCPAWCLRLGALPLQCLLFLEKELVTLGAMCAASLLREDTALPFAGQQICTVMCLSVMYTSIASIHLYMYMYTL